jgi:murein DD-endopeptidase MepM/ murein hydrolase activator NlpD
VIVDHGNSEYSVMMHMQPDSVTVKVGDRVATGQVIGRLGNSGDAFGPHLHYHVPVTLEVNVALSASVRAHRLFMTSRCRSGFKTSMIHNSPEARISTQNRLAISCGHTRPQVQLIPANEDEGCQGKHYTHGNSSIE